MPRNESRKQMSPVLGLLFTAEAVAEILKVPVSWIEEHTRAHLKNESQALSPLRQKNIEFVFLARDPAPETSAATPERQRFPIRARWYGPAEKKLSWSECQERMLVSPSQGSTLAFIPKEWNRPIFTSANLELRPRCQGLAQTAMVTMRESGAKKAAHAGSVSIALTLYFEKPKSERKSALPKTTKPDRDKWLRAILDWLTGIAYEDDAQVCECRVVKVFGSPARLEVQLRTLDEGVPKTLRIHRPHLFENTQPVGSEIGLSKTHDFGRAG